MKTIRPVFSFGLSLSFAIASFAVTATAQTGAPFSSQMNALGGKFASPGMGRPLGGINNPRGGPGGGQRRGGQPAVAVPYGYSYYVPGYFDSLGFSSVGTPSSVAEYNAASWPAVLPSSSPALAPQTATAPSVIINQYFTGSPVGSGGRWRIII